MKMMQMVPMLMITQSESNHITINGPLVKSMIESMRVATQKSANSCAKKAKQMLQELKRNAIAPAKIEEIMIVLGFSRDRAGEGILDADKKKKVTKWLQSIICSAASSTDEEEMNTDSDVSGAESIGPSSKMVAYAFPYDILNANEVRDLLRSHVGSTATTTGRVPGP